MMERQTLIDNAKYIIIPSFEHGDRDGIFDEYLKGKPFIKLSVNDKDRLWNLPRNNHHMNTKWHYTVLLNTLLDVLSIDDFRFGDYHFEKSPYGKEYDVLKRNVNDIYDVTVAYREWNNKDEGLFLQWIKHEVVTSSELSSVGECYDFAFFGDVLQDPYHRLFRYSHLPVRLTNKNVQNGKTLIISCDSHMIPTISILSHYYENTIVFDNRVCIGTYDTLTNGINEDKTDCLFVMWEDNDLENYLEMNLK